MKQKIVNTRVSNDLYDTISSRARARGVTISNLIRNIVEDSLDISGEVVNIVDEKIKNRLKGTGIRIIGYQQLTLANEAECDICGKELKKGALVYITFTDNKSESLVICAESKKELESENETKKEGK